ncbi:MAG: Uma2 family endonuclease [Chloroflexota bacterium]
MVEVASKNNTKIELHDKAIAFFEAGVQLVWIVYPKSKTVVVYHTQRDVTVLGIDDTLMGGNVLPSFAVKLADIFAVLN